MSAKYAKRFEAVFLCKHAKGPKLSFVSAAKVIKKSKSFVEKWVKRFDLYKNVDDYDERGTKRVTSKKQDKVIVSLFKKTPNMRLRQARVQLAKKGIHVSINTIQRRLQAANVKYRPTILKPLLSQKHVEKRRAWAEENKDRDWTKVVFSDEATFWAWLPLKRAWSSCDTRIIQRTIKHPVKVNVWGCFSQRGFGCLELFTQNLNAEKMLKIYKRGLLKSVEKMFGKKTENWVLQEDNDPKHRSRLCKAWKEENGVTTMDWPSQSPDANPIENVWGIMKSQLAGKPVHDLKQLARAIRKIWRSLSVDYAQKLVESMPNRCEAILQNDGDYTVY